MALGFAEPFLIDTTVCTERVCRLQYYSQVVAVYITLQTICSLTISISGLPRAHSDGVAYPDAGLVRKKKGGALSPLAFFYPRRVASYR